MTPLDDFLLHLRQTPLAEWAEAHAPALISKGLDPARYGDLPRWQAALTQLPELAVSSVDLAKDCVTVSGPAENHQRQQLETALRGLHPWRKGPFSLFDVDIDTEWRSDFKWQRLISHISPLAGRQVLDVGCGSGYHLWRMRGEGAATAMGIDPTPLFLCQFFALQRYIQDAAVGILPVGIEALPARWPVFDTVFSMGVLYHRRSPFDHLIHLRELLVPGGELVLETLVIDGPKGQVLVPSGRYARMGNVWFLPSAETLPQWLEKAGFKNVRLADVTVTGLDEQRRTDWMTFHSLEQFLDPEDHSKTVEGYPAPRRAIVIAQKPG